MFKRGTGMTIRGYLHRLRLAHALARVEDGESSLMRVALESGFYSHSHLTATCTRLLGSPPAALRLAN
jgi:AraC-like DNA-binding protein